MNSSNSIVTQFSSSNSNYHHQPQQPSSSSTSTLNNNHYYTTSQQQYYNRHHQNQTNYSQEQQQSQHQTFALPPINTQFESLLDTPLPPLSDETSRLLFALPTDHHQSHQQQHHQTNLNGNNKSLQIGNRRSHNHVNAANIIKDSQQHQQTNNNSQILAANHTSNANSTSITTNPKTLTVTTTGNQDSIHTNNKSIINKPNDPLLLSQHPNNLYSITNTQNNQYIQNQQQQQNGQQIPSVSNYTQFLNSKSNHAANNNATTTNCNNNNVAPSLDTISPFTSMRQDLLYTCPPTNAHNSQYHQQHQYQRHPNTGATSTATIPAQTTTHSFFSSNNTTNNNHNHVNNYVSHHPHQQQRPKQFHPHQFSSIHPTPPMTPHQRTFLNLPDHSNLMDSNQHHPSQTNSSTTSSLGTQHPHQIHHYQQQQYQPNYTNSFTDPSTSAINSNNGFLMDNSNMFATNHSTSTAVLNHQPFFDDIQNNHAYRPMHLSQQQQQLNHLDLMSINSTSSNYHQQHHQQQQQILNGLLPQPPSSNINDAATATMSTGNNGISLETNPIVPSSKEDHDILNKGNTLSSLTDPNANDKELDDLAVDGANEKKENIIKKRKRKRIKKTSGPEQEQVEGQDKQNTDIVKESNFMNYGMKVDANLAPSGHTASSLFLDPLNHSTTLHHVTAPTTGSCSTALTSGSVQHIFSHNNVMIKANNHETTVVNKTGTTDIDNTLLTIGSDGLVVVPSILIEDSQDTILMMNQNTSSNVNLSSKSRNYPISNDPKYVCACGKQFQRLCGFKSHIRVHEANQQTLIQSEYGTSKWVDAEGQEIRYANEDCERRFSCEDCGRNFIRRHDLRRHIKIIHHDGRKKLGCPHCQTTFSRSDALYKHLKTRRCMSD